MKIKTGDNVKVLSGKSKGKTGKVIQVLNGDKGAYVVIDGVNLRKKHLKAQGREAGRTIELAAPLNMSNVMLIEARTGKPTRVGYKMDGDKKKRVAKKSGEFID